MANCTYPRGPLEAENDIVGPGALAAFFATAAITYLTVIMAYITDTLDEDLINPFDAQVIKMTKKIHRKFKPEDQESEAGMHDAATSRADLSSDAVKKARKDAISNFLISLSDQQLVTGLAVLVAAVSGQQTLTGYEFSVATCLGWFSCTTHLTTIDVLCVRFRRHRKIRHVRVAGLVCLMGLLSYAFIRTTSITRFRIPIDCPRNTPWVNYTDILCLLPLWVDYFSAVRKIYLGPLTSFWDVTELRGSKSRRNECDGAEGISAVDQLTAKKTEGQSEEIQDLVKRHGKHARSHLGLFLYDGSFLGTFPDMTYSFCFAIAQVVVYRWDGTELSEESTEMGFGQITALLLLLLPFLAIGEAWTSYSVASRSSVASKGEADSLCKMPVKDVRGAEDDPEKARAACPQAAEPAKPQQSHHRPPGQSSAVIMAGSLQHDTLSGDVGLEITRPNVPDAPRGSDCDQDTGDPGTHSQELQNDKDLKQYFPLSMDELSTLRDERVSATRRQSLLHRRDTLKTAENNLGLRWPLAFFGLHLSIGVMASVFLNSYNDRLVLAGTILNALSVVLGNLKTVHRLLRLFRKIRTRQT